MVLFGFLLKAVIIEKTLKEEWTNKNNFYDNYNYYTIIVHTITKFQFFNFERTANAVIVSTVLFVYMFQFNGEMYWMFKFSKSPFNTLFKSSTVPFNTSCCVALPSISNVDRLGILRATDNVPYCTDKTTWKIYKKRRRSEQM